MNLSQMLGHMGIVGLGVMLTLLLLSVHSVRVILAKHMAFRKADQESRAFAAEFGRCLKEGQLQAALAVARRHAGSPVAQVASAGMAELIDHRQGPSDARTQAELVAEILDQSAARTLAEMRRGLGGLATIGSTAPFIGLFGTVVGIIHAFEGIASTGSGGVAVVSGGIAESLIATALGILVAIPAVMAFNYFTGALERFHVEIGAASAQLVTFVKRSAWTHATR